MVKRLLFVGMLAAVVAACGTSPDAAAPGQPQSETTQSAPMGPPIHTRPSATPDEATRGQPPSQSDQSNVSGSVELKLIPYKGEGGFKLLVPAGWQAMPTALGDSVQWSHDSVRIFVLAKQLRGQAVPHTLEEMKRYIAVADAAPDAKVRDVKVTGAERAFEVTYNKHYDGEITFLDLYMFGSTYKEILSFEVPTNLYPQWEPLFRQIMQSYQPGNLNAVPLPGRP